MSKHSTPHIIPDETSGSRQKKQTTLFSFLCFLWIPVFTGMTVGRIALAQATPITFETATSTATTSTDERPFAPTDGRGVLPHSPTKLYADVYALSADDLDDGAVVKTTATTTVELPPADIALTVAIKELAAFEMPASAWASTTTSTVWQIDVKQADGAIWFPTPYQKITLPTEGPFYYKKVVYFWDGNKQDWRTLPSETDFTKKTVTARYPLPYGRFIVRDHPTVFEGIASWYRWKGGHFAAFRHLPKGTTLKVTNISGSTRHGKFTEITVNDYGPEEWTGRLIDLDYHAYWHIGLPRGGTMPVRVELVK